MNNLRRRHAAATPVTRCPGAAMRVGTGLVVREEKNRSVLQPLQSAAIRAEQNPSGPVSGPVSDGAVAQNWPFGLGHPDRLWSCLLKSNQHRNEIHYKIRGNDSSDHLTWKPTGPVPSRLNQRCSEMICWFWFWFWSTGFYTVPTRTFYSFIEMLGFIFQQDLVPTQTANGTSTCFVHHGNTWAWPLTPERTWSGGRWGRPEPQQNLSRAQNCRKIFLH